MDEPGPDVEFLSPDGASYFQEFSGECAPLDIVRTSRGRPVHAGCLSGGAIERLAIGVEEIGLTEETLNALQSRGITTVEHLLNSRLYELLSIADQRPGMIEEIQRALEHHGFQPLAQP